MLKKDTIRGKNSFQSRESYKWKPFLDLTTKTGQKQLINLLKPLTQEQADALEKLKSQMKDLKKFKNGMWAELAKQAIDKANKLGVNTIKYQKDFSLLGKEAYMNDIIHSFVNFKQYSDTKSFKEYLVKDIEKGLSLGITNDEINVSLLAFIEEELSRKRKIMSSIQLTPDDKFGGTEEYWDENDRLQEEELPTKEQLLNLYSKEISFLETTLNDLKANPVDFTKFLDPQAWNKE